MGLTVSLQKVSVDPIELVALHTYSPSSSGYTSLIVRVQMPFLYFKSITSEELKGFLFLDHVTCGSGSPLT